MNKYLGGLVLASFAVTAVMAAELPDRIKTARKVTVATQPVYPPMEYRDPATGELKGIDIDLSRALGKQLGVEVVWAETSFEQMVSSATTGRVDLIHSGMADTPKRRESLDFVDYMKSGPQFYSVTSRRNDIKTPSDLCGKTIGMSRLRCFRIKPQTGARRTAKRQAGHPSYFRHRNSPMRTQLEGQGPR